MANELFSSGGYRLDVFQLYNWGLFDKVIYSLDCAQGTTLLTGANGSGKTTIVDGLLSLLVPPQQRHYNQSSGADKKRDRTEENYVLGAYGNRLEEENSYSKSQTLRTRETFSILNGVFVHEEINETLSLLQVRYFSDNALQRVYALTKQKLRIEQINKILSEEESSFDKQGRWKRILSEKYNTVFFGDSFKKYSDFYSSLFGFKSDKALRLFSQIVGLKVLGNLTEFIRTNMLEETDVYAEFEKLDTNYIKLMQSNNEIQKTKKILELLEPILELGKKLEKEKSEKNRLETISSLVPLWKAEKAIFLLTENKIILERNKADLESQLSQNRKEKSETDNKISSLQISLATNDTQSRIETIDREINIKTDEKKRRDLKRSQYEKMANEVGISIPTNETMFRNNFEKIVEKEKAEIELKKTNEDIRFNNQTEFNTLQNEAEIIKNELASLSKRNTNIPDANIKIRDSICQKINCKADEIPFAGELIQVASNEQNWNYAIEKLLHSFALTLLVPEKLYKKVTNYVKENNMKGRVVYFKIEEDGFSLESKIQLQKDSDTVPGKLEIKENVWVRDWLVDYIAKQFDYRCTDNIEEFSRAHKAVSSTGLIKNKMRHEKDDRQFSDEKKLKVLGWDNKEKKNILSSRYDEIESLQLKQTTLLNEIDKAIEISEKKIRLLENLKDIVSYQEIDVVSIVKNIDDLQDEQNTLKKSDKELFVLRTQLEDALSKKKQLDKLYGDISVEIGGVNSKLSSIDTELLENQNKLDVYKNKEITSELVYKEFQILSEPKSIDELNKNHEKINKSLDERISTCKKHMDGFSKNVTQNMTILLKPSVEFRNRYGDWASEFLHLNSEVEYLPDFILLYEKLKKDDLPKYQEQFHEYLQDTMNNDIVDFNQFIQNEEQEIRTAISDLNASLRKIRYEHNPDTYLQLEFSKNNDVRINEFKEHLKNAIPNAFDLSSFDSEKEEELFNKIKLFLDTVKANDANRKYILDIRNWYTFAASEKYKETGIQKQFYPDSGSLSGGEKAKLTYTILASAIAYQFGLTQEESARSFRFAIIDEAFSKSDSANSDYAMRLFKQLDLQIMVITPQDKINIVEDYISTVHITEKIGTKDSRLLPLTIERYKEQQKEVLQGKKI